MYDFRLLCLRACCGTLLLTPAAAADQQIYKYLDAEGRVMYTDQPREAAADLDLIDTWTWKGWESPGYDARGRLNQGRFAAMIEAAARRHDLSPRLVHAVVRVESAYRPDAVSQAGAVGLMQLMPETARRFGVQDRRDPGSNLEGGSRYLRHLLKLYDGDLKLALAAYNAGEGAVQRAGRNIPPYRETRRYVQKVLGLLNTEPQTGIVVKTENASESARKRQGRGGVEQAPPLSFVKEPATPRRRRIEQEAAREKARGNPPARQPPPSKP